MKILKWLILISLGIICFIISSIVSILSVIGLSLIIPSTFILYNILQFMLLIGVSLSLGYLFGDLIFNKLKNKLI